SRAVSMMMGTVRPAARTSRQTSMPSFTGSMRSSRIRSGCSPRASRTASSPSKAQTTWYPSFSRLNLMMSAIGRSSSTTRIFAATPVTVRIMVFIYIIILGKAVVTADERKRRDAPDRTQKKEQRSKKRRMDRAIARRGRTEGRKKAAGLAAGSPFFPWSRTSLVQVFQRILHLALLEHFKMQMHAGGIAGASHHADFVALFDDVAFGHANFAQVGI